MKNYRFLWLRNRTTNNRKCEKARNIKEKRTIEMFSPACCPAAKHSRSSLLRLPCCSSAEASRREYCLCGKRNSARNTNVRSAGDSALLRRLPERRPPDAPRPRLNGSARSAVP